MTTSSNGEYFAIISQLMAEKDRLITEKDELVVSKDRLWREMYQMLQEKNQRTADLSDQQTSDDSQDKLEIQQLCGEVSFLKRRNRELEHALRDALETDRDCEDGLVENENKFMEGKESFSEARL